MGANWQPAASQAAASRTDLVAEVHHQHVEAEQEIVRRRRRRVRRTIVVTILSVALLAGLGFAGKLAWDHHRRSRAVDSAHAHLQAATSEDLQSALDDLDESLVVAPGDDESLTMLALVRAHQAPLSGDATALREALERVPDPEAPAAILARGVAAAVEGDLAGVQTALDATTELDDERPLRRTRAWLQGVHALARIHELERVPEAIAALEATVSDDAWVPGHRRLIALQLRAGRLDDARARLQAARSAAPADLGLAVDEALLFAVAAEHEDGVVEVTERLESDERLTPRDRGRARLARALVALREGESGRKNGRASLEAAWDELPAWDLDARDLAIEAALFSGWTERAETWAKSLNLDEEPAAIYRAWIELTEGDVGDSLEQCAKLPQAHPRVAWIQALALVEQGRWAEAGTWIERASAAFPERLTLRVAAARVQAHVADPEAAVEVLEELADDDPGTPRVYTGLGQARLAVAGEKGSTSKAKKALRLALDHEPHPAEAAFLLGTLAERDAADKPAKIDEVIELFDKAAKIDPTTPRYRSNLGRVLAGYGDRARAEEVLRTLPDEPAPAPDDLLLLSRVVIERALRHGEKIPREDVEGWLTKAAEMGGNPVDLVHERARLELAAGGPEALAQTAANLGALLAQHPKDVSARVMHARALRRLGDLEGARASVREGIRRTLIVLDGRLYIEWAAIEDADGNERRAASLAYKGWRKVVAEPRPADELMILARIVADYWLAIDNTDVPRGVAKALLKRVPTRAEAFAFSARMHHLDGVNDEGCADAKKALELDPELAESHAARAECLISQHDYPKAREELQAAISRAKVAGERDQYRRRLRVVR